MTKTHKHLADIKFDSFQAFEAFKLSIISIHKIYNSMDIVIGLCHDDRIDIDTFSESVESSSKLS